MVGFIAKPTIFVSLRGRRAAVAIFKPKAWHPAAKHGSTKRQNPEILNRRGATPPRRFSGSAISRGRKPAFPVCNIFHTIKDRISRRSSGRASFRDAVSFRQSLPRRAQKMRPPRNDKSDRVCWKTKRFAGKRNGLLENETVFRTKRLKNDAERLRAERPHKAKTSVSQIKPSQFRVIARPQSGRGNLKAEGMAFLGEARYPCEADFKHFGNKNGRFYCKTYHFCVIARPQRGRGNL